jgi:hypothetical protein
MAKDQLTNKAVNDISEIWNYTADINCFPSAVEVIKD